MLVNRAARVSKRFVINAKILYVKACLPKGHVPPLGGFLLIINVPCGFKKKRLKAELQLQTDFLL